MAGNGRSLGKKLVIYSGIIYYIFRYTFYDVHGRNIYLYLWIRFINEMDSAVAFLVFGVLLLAWDSNFFGVRMRYR